jgi:hypothetical protein
MAIDIENPSDTRATPLLRSRIQAFIKRVERRGRTHDNPPKAIDMPTFLAGCLAQVTRLADYVGHMVSKTFPSLLPANHLLGWCVEGF